MPTRRLLLVVLSVALASAPAVAAPRDELLRYVSDEVGFCLVVQDLRGQSAQILDSPFAQALGKSPLVAAIGASKEWKQLDEVEKYLKQHLGVGWKEIRDDLLGDAFVFAYRPGPPGKPDQEQGLFLLRARSEKPLADFVRKLEQLQKTSRELKAVEEREHKGVKYFCRVERGEKNYYLLRGKVLLFSHQEALLRQAIEKDQALPRDAVPALSRRLRDLGLDNALVALTVQPRA